VETLYRPNGPFDLALTLGRLRSGPFDPTVRIDAQGAYWRATRTPEGPATSRVVRLPSGDVQVQAWGDGAEWVIASAPELLGARDTLDGFEPDGKLAALHRRFLGMRIGRSRAVFETAAAVALEQLVTSREAHTSWRRLVLATSELAPGPLELWLPPTPEALAAFPLFELRAVGVDAKRGRALHAIARHARRLDEATELALDAARSRLLAVPGIGPWTAACVAGEALGDADAVAVGDFHLANTVTYAFTGDPRGDDARMLGLLAPYAGHRGRVVRLIEAAGIHAPRFGPRRPLRRA
jgi:3-methyladenine DNA glycosylase/8-oxoguanine DNA glycosylase